MKPNIFLPDLQKIYSDNLGEYLKQIAQVFIIFCFALLPIFFIPGVFTFLGYTKVYLVAVFLLLAIIFSCFSILRSGVIRLFIPLSLAFFWFLAIISLVSALLTSDRTEAIYGGVVDTGSASFLILLAVVMTVAQIFRGGEGAIKRTVFGLGIAALLLQLFQVLRVIVGPEFLSFKVFNTNTSSLIGSFNDLAIFSGLTVIIGLVYLQSVRDSLVRKILLTILVLLSLFTLALVNFQAVWMVVGFVSFIILLYTIARDTWLRGSVDASGNKISRFTLVLVGVTCLISAFFVIGGDFFSGALSRATGISYLEVRPSFTATTQIIDSVWSQNILLGSGTNRFEDAWRQFKDPAINATALWTTDFNAGNGYFTTLLVTTGLAGGLALLGFLLTFLYVGYQLLYQMKLENEQKYRLATVVFAAALYLWLMSLLYVPGVVLLLLAALATGFTFAIYAEALPGKGLLLNVSEKRQYGMLLIIFVLVVISTSVVSFIKVSKNYYANVIYNKALVTYVQNQNPAELDSALARATLLNPIDTYVAERARLRLVEIGRINALQEPTPADEQKFSTAMNEGADLSSRAIALDPTDPDNYLLLANFLAVYDPSTTPAVKERTESILKQAQALDPKNPSYLLGLAQYATRSGDNAAAKSYLTEAVRLKPNYTAALLQYASIDIAEGNATSAIAITRSIISIEPQNPARYLQLGLLLAASNDLNNAILAYKSALTLDPNYANARYYLALAYNASGKRDEAIAELKIVQNTNQDNELVKRVIERLESGLPTEVEAGKAAEAVVEGEVKKDGEVITTDNPPKSDLITPVNAVPESNPSTPADNQTTVEASATSTQ